MQVDYSDGVEMEQKICSLIDEAKDVSSDSNFAARYYDEWPIRYHLCPERANLLRHLNFSGLDVLELGAGMGGASRHVAEQAKSFYAVEGTQQRLKALKKRLKGLENWDAKACNIEKFETTRRFDAVLLIGVLEYAELYMDPLEGESAFEKLMLKARSFLKPGGVVIVAIENKNGIKYWAGAPEDHTGQMFDGICGYPGGKSVQTFSRSQLIQVFANAGMSEIEEFYPWPDYKISHSVISRRFAEKYPQLSADIAVEAIMREPISGVHYFPTTLAIYETADSGLFSEFANSFLFVGGPDEDSIVRASLFRNMDVDQEIAWHYSLARKVPARTVFCFDSHQPNIPYVKKDFVKRRDRRPAKSSPDSVVNWDYSNTVEVFLEPKLSTVLRRAAYFEGYDAFESELIDFLRWSLDRWSLEDEPDHLDPQAFDAIFKNAAKGKDTYRIFDLEWVLAQPMSKSWFIFRNVCNITLITNLCQVIKCKTAGELYQRLCRALGVEHDLFGDIMREAAAQIEIGVDSTFDGLVSGLTSTMEAPLQSAVFPRDASQEQTVRRDVVDNPEVHATIQALMAENLKMKQILAKRCVKIALALDARLRRHRQFFSMLRACYSWGSRFRRT